MMAWTSEVQDWGLRVRVFMSCCMAGLACIQRIRSVIEKETHRSTLAKDAPTIIQAACLYANHSGRVVESIGSKEVEQ